MGHSLSLREAKADMEQRLLRNAAYSGSIPLAYSATFLLQLMSTYLEMVRPTVGWVLLHDSS